MYIDPDGKDIELPWNNQAFLTRLNLLFDGKLKFKLVDEGYLGRVLLRPQDAIQKTEAQLKDLGLNDVQINAYNYIYKLATDTKKIKISSRPITFC